MSPAWERSAGLWDGHLSQREVHQGAVLKVFDCKTTGGVLAALGLDFRLGILHTRWLRRGAAPAYACLALRASWLLVLSPILGLGRALAHPLAPARY